jgi:hypothetical protein
MTHELVLHIGANKTGSSAIQSFIRANLELLEGNGYAVPDAELGWSQRITGFHVFGLADILAEGSSSDRCTAVFDELMQQAPAGKSVLISAENLSNPGSHRFFQDVCARYSTRILIYIRRQDELLTSTWQQWNSKIETDLNAWIVRALRSTGNWGQILDAWEQVAGRAALTVRIYERKEFRDGNIIYDFMDWLGLGHFSAEARLPDEETNPSYSDFITPLVVGNRNIFRDVHDNDFYKMVGKLTGEAYAKRKRVSLISREMRDAIMDHFRHQNDRVCKNYFPGRARLFSPVDHSKYDYLTRDELQIEQMRFLAEMIFKLSEKVIPLRS